MMKRAVPFAFMLLLVSGGALAADAPEKPLPPQAQAERVGTVKTAVAVLAPTEGSKVNGTVYFHEQGNDVHVVGDIYGLQPNSEHGFHIHEWGDLSSPDGEAAGDHYNPQGHPHALPEQKQRHAGDLGNLKADAEGHARIEVTVRNVTISGSNNPILGRALIVHAQPDTGEQPSGGAGPRLAQAVIGIGNPDQAEGQATRSRVVR